MKAYIVCCGTSGRCVIYGRSATEPVQGKPCRLEHARMVVYWSGGGLLGLASTGPREGSRITAPVPVTVTSPVTEWVEVADAASAEIDQWPSL